MLSVGGKGRAFTICLAYIAQAHTSSLFSATVSMWMFHTTHSPVKLQCDKVRMYCSSSVKINSSNHPDRYLANEPCKSEASYFTMAHLPEHPGFTSLNYPRRFNCQSHYNHYGINIFYISFLKWTWRAKEAGARHHRINATSTFGTCS